jgi:integrase/recombinase XerD
MRIGYFGDVSLFSLYGSRKYLNAEDRRRFVEATRLAPTRIRLFCLTLYWSGARISEVLALTPLSIDADEGAIAFQTLKRRKPGVIRQVPLPPGLLAELEAEFGLRAAQYNPDLATRRIWRFSRTTAWRYVKRVMSAAGIAGAAAMPKGLRHGFGVNAALSNVPVHLLQRWFGHASLRTTGIYYEVIGPEERAIAERMWRLH